MTRIIVSTLERIGKDAYYLKDKFKTYEQIRVVQVVLDNKTTSIGTCTVVMVQVTCTYNVLLR
jgi:hypothetical protein